MPKAIYLVNRITEEPTPAIPSLSDACDRCSTAVWVDPKALAQAEEQSSDLEKVCQVCWTEHLAGDQAAEREDGGEDGA